jgi:uncharacterized phage protein (TIGR01671 family)
MRPIKFRGLSVVNDKHNKIKVGDFIYGSFIQSNIDAPCIIWGDGEQIEINPETLGQFTGLTDKNGVDIYEGDILLVVNKSHSYAEIDNEKRVVKFSEYLDNEQYIDDKHLGWNVGGLLIVDCLNDGSAVIGNIYQSPELMEK